MSKALLAVVFALAPSLAFAHVDIADASGVAHGFMHPLSGMDHILAMVAVGLFAAHLGGRALWLVPVSRDWISPETRRAANTRRVARRRS